MTTMSTPVDVSRPFTVADLEGMPDDGRRYELIDGELLVSPAPGWPHQELTIALAMALRTVCPREFRVLVAPFAVRPNKFTELQPDVLVARYADLTLEDLPKPPLLAVEVISPTSRLRDRSLKRAAYAQLGVPSFWLVDPDPELPVIAAYQLRDGEYDEVGGATGGAALEAVQPFPVRIVPAELVAGLRP